MTLPGDRGWDAMPITEWDVLSEWRSARGRFRPEPSKQYAYYSNEQYLSMCVVVNYYDKTSRVLAASIAACIGALDEVFLSRNYAIPQACSDGGVFCSRADQPLNPVNPN